MIGEPTSNRRLADLSRAVVEGSETVSRTVRRRRIGHEMRPPADEHRR